MQLWWKFLQWQRFLMATVEVSTCIIHCCTSLVSVERQEECVCCLPELIVGRARLSEHLIETWDIYLYELERLLFSFSKGVQHSIAA